MKTSYLLPSGDYNIFLSEEDLEKLLTTGNLSVRLSRTPCRTHRAVYDRERNTLVPHDEKEIYNALCFHLDEPVDDLEPGFWNIQFLNITLPIKKLNRSEIIKKHAELIEKRKQKLNGKGRKKR